MFSPPSLQVYNTAMSTEQIVQLLILKRNRLDAAIAALGAAPKRRGRPPKHNPFANAWVGVSEPQTSTTRIASPKTRKGRTFTPAQKEAARLRMQNYWKARRKAEKK